VDHTVTTSGTPFPSMTRLVTRAPVTVVSPLRIDTGTIAGVLPGAVRLEFVFTPEPGSGLLFVSGAVGLAVLAGRRARTRARSRRAACARDPD